MIDLSIGTQWIKIYWLSTVTVGGNNSKNRTATGVNDYLVIVRVSKLELWDSLSK